MYSIYEDLSVWIYIWKYMHSFLIFKYTFPWNFIPILYFKTISTNHYHISYVCILYKSLFSISSWTLIIPIFKFIIKHKDIFMGLMNIKCVTNKYFLVDMFVFFNMQKWIIYVGLKSCKRFPIFFLKSCWLLAYLCCSPIHKYLWLYQLTSSILTAWS